MNPLFRLIPLAAAVALATGCANKAPTSPAAVPAANVPATSSDFPEATPESAGVDARKLIQLSQWLREGQLDVRSLLIVKDGKLVFERYSEGLTRDHNYELYSITKGITSLLAGMMIDEKKLGLDDGAADVIGRWRPATAPAFADKRDVSLRHLLSMSTGLQYDFKPTDDPIYYGAPDRLKLAAGTRQKEAPGKTFEYTDVSPILAAAMVSAAAGKPIDQLARERLFVPMGMKNADWDRADGTGLVSSGWGLRLRAMDMAKIGQLVLDGGRWQGRQLVSQDWVTQMTTPKVAPDFGYYWWVHNIVKGEAEIGSMGFKGQFITVLPEHHAVIVMTSMLSVKGGLREADCVNTFRQVVNDYVIPAMASAKPAAEASASEAALKQELAASLKSRGVPGVSADPTDTPRL